MKCLVFHISGAMESWGNAFMGSFRTSDMHPTKSTIVGIISAALGIDRYDVDSQGRLFRDYEYVVACADGATKVVDYHTVGTAPVPNQTEVIKGGYRRNELFREKQNTILSEREYVCNGYYTVFMIPTNGDDENLERYSAALERPRFTVYLGRKSCPMSFPMCPEVLHFNRLYDLVVKKALEPFLRPEFEDASYLGKHDGMRIYSTFDVDGFDPVSVSRRYDDDADHVRWQFDERPEYEYVVMRQ